MDSSGSAPDHNAATGKQKRKNRMGGASRQRCAKLRDIQAAEERIWRGETIEVPTRTTVPTDRDKVWPGVLEQRGEGGLTLAEESSLVSQLGYVPGNALCVAAHAQQVPLLPVDNHVPILLKLYPLAIRDSFAGEGSAGGRRFRGRKQRSSSSIEDTTATDSKDTSSQTSTGNHYWNPFPLNIG